MPPARDNRQLAAPLGADRIRPQPQIALDILNIGLGLQPRHEPAHEGIEIERQDGAVALEGLHRRRHRHRAAARGGQRIERDTRLACDGRGERAPWLKLDCEARRPCLGGVRDLDAVRSRAPGQRANRRGACR